MTRFTLAFLSLFFCAQAIADDGLSVHGAWTRATPPGASNSASYLVLRNSTAVDRSLVAVASTAATEIQLHRVFEQDGLMKMRAVSHILVPAGGEAVLSTGGYHMMMLGVGQALRDGQRIELELSFANGEKLLLVSAVQKTAGVEVVDHSTMDHSTMDHDN